MSDFFVPYCTEITSCMTTHRPQKPGYGCGLNKITGFLDGGG